MGHTGYCLARQPTYWEDKASAGSEPALVPSRSPNQQLKSLQELMKEQNPQTTAAAAAGAHIAAAVQAAFNGADKMEPEMKPLALMD